MIEVEHDLGENDDGGREVLRELAQKVAAHDEARHVDVAAVILVSDRAGIDAALGRDERAKDRDGLLGSLTADEHHL